MRKQTRRLIGILRSKLSFVMIGDEVVVVDVGLWLSGVSGFEIGIFGLFEEIMLYC